MLQSNELTDGLPFAEVLSIEDVESTEQPERV
jgi:hypothetical protein